MKKFLAILLAVLTVLSATSMMAFAADAEIKCPYGCDYVAKGTTTEAAQKLMDEHLKACAKKPVEPKTTTDAFIACSICGATYTDLGNMSKEQRLQEHYTLEHNLKCNFCGKAFTNTTDLQKHLDESFAVDNHEVTCGNWKDKNFNGVKDEGEVCTHVFTTKVAFDAHQKNCDCKDTRSDTDMLIGYFKAGNLKDGFKTLFKIIVDFIKSDDFKKIVDKVGELVKKINFDKVVSTVKDAVSKLPLDKVADLIKK